MIYLDASVLLAVLIADSHTGAASVWYSDLSATVIVSDLANLEVSAVLSRDLRVGKLTRAAVDAALLDFDAMRAGGERLSHGVDDFMLAERILRDFARNLQPQTPSIWRAREERRRGAGDLRFATGRCCADEGRGSGWAGVDLSPGDTVGA